MKGWRLYIIILLRVLTGLTKKITVLALPKNHSFLVYFHNLMGFCKQLRSKFYTQLILSKSIVLHLWYFYTSRSLAPVPRRLQLHAWNCVFLYFSGLGGTQIHFLKLTIIPKITLGYIRIGYLRSLNSMASKWWRGGYRSTLSPLP